MKEEILFNKIMGINGRLRELKKQGESSSNKTLKSMRTRRNKIIKELFELFTENSSYYEELKKELGK